MNGAQAVMADAPARKTTSRRRSPATKKTAETQAAIEAAIKGVLDDLTHEQLAELGPREGLLRVMRWALRAGALPLFIELATALMPYTHGKKATVAGRIGATPSIAEIAADLDPEMAD